MILTCFSMLEGASLAFNLLVDFGASFLFVFWGESWYIFLSLFSISLKGDYFCSFYIDLLMEINLCFMIAVWFSLFKGIFIHLVYWCKFTSFFWSVLNFELHLLFGDFTTFNAALKLLGDGLMTWVINLLFVDRLLFFSVE